MPVLRLLNCFWLPLICRTESDWSSSSAGLLAPVYTPLICLAGIALR